MVNRPKIAGTAAETWVKEYAQETYWPHARRLALAGKNDIGDIDLFPEIMVEVKATQGALRIGGWMTEVDVQQYRKQAEFGLLVVKTAGYGPRNVPRFLTCMRHGLATRLLDEANVEKATEYTYHSPSRIDPLIQLAKLEDRQATVGNMYNMVTYRTRGEEDPDMWYSFMRLGPRLELFNLAGYGRYLKGNIDEHQNPPDRL